MITTRAAGAGWERGEEMRSCIIGFFLHRGEDSINLSITLPFFCPLYYGVVYSYCVAPHVGALLYPPVRVWQLLLFLIITRS